MNSAVLVIKTRRPFPANVKKANNDSHCGIEFIGELKASFSLILLKGDFRQIHVNKSRDGKPGSQFPSSSLTPFLGRETVTSGEARWQRKDEFLF